MKTSADSLKKSADALNDASLWEKKKIKKKDEKTGEKCIRDRAYADAGFVYDTKMAEFHGQTMKLFEPRCV